MSYSAIHNKSKEETSDWWSHINCKQEDSEHLQRTAERQEVTLSLRARDTAGQRERERQIHSFGIQILHLHFCFSLHISALCEFLFYRWPDPLNFWVLLVPLSIAVLVSLSWSQNTRRMDPTWSDVVMINMLINNMFSHPTSPELTVWVWGGRDKEDDHAGHPDEPAEKTDIWQKPQEKCDLLMKKN